MNIPDDYSIYLRLMNNTRAIHDNFVRNLLANKKVARDYFKSYPDNYTSLQIGGYIFSALQKQAQNNEPLSLVIPVLLYHGKERWQYRTLTNLFDDIEEEWKQYLPDFEYI